MSIQRITAKDVLSAFEYFTHVAEKQGHTVTDYQLTEGSTANHRAWRVQLPTTNNNPKVITIGYTPREAYQYISGMVTGLDL